MSNNKPQTPFAEAVFARIEGECIEPRPRWHFVLREVSVWVTGGVAVGVGAGAVAASLYEIRFAWWDMYLVTHESFFDFALDALPYVWLVCFGVFAFVVYTSVRHTKCGYKYSVRTLLLSSVVLSGVFGSALYAGGLGRFFDEGMGAYMPLHAPLFDRERHMWLQFDEGRIAGVVRDLPRGDGSLWLEDMSGKVYAIDVSAFDGEEVGVLRAGDHVRVIGVPSTSTEALFGCIMVLRRDDILRHIGAHEESVREKKMLLARSTECGGVRPYARLMPQRQ